MMKAPAGLEKAWRVAGTGLALSALLWGGLILATGVVPPVFLVVRNPVKRKRVMLSIISALHLFYMRCLVRFRLMAHFRVEGMSGIPARPALYVANHPTLLDVVALFGALPRAGCVVKGGLFRHRFWGGVVRAAGYISNEDGPAMLEATRRHFQEGFSLIVFPEGTRSPPGGLHPFRMGAARIALHCGVPIVPVTIKAEPGFLRKHEPWYRVPERRPIFEIRFYPPLEYPVVSGEEQTLRVRRCTQDLETFFEDKTGLRRRAMLPTEKITHA